MNAHLKMLLNVSGIAKRNGRFTLARARKVCVNIFISRLVYRLKHLLRSFDIRTFCQKLLRRLWRYAFSLGHEPASIMPL